jgi:signal peptidase II
VKSASLAVRGSSGRTRALLLLLVIVATVGCDRATKRFAAARLEGGGTHSYLGGTVRLAYAENTGAFLSLGATWPEWARRGALGTVVAASLIGIAYVAWRHRGGGPMLLGLCLILAGGGSNLFDRVAWGHVVDFMILRAGPLQTGIFNVADVAITLGVVLVLLGGRKRPPAGAHAA